MKILIVDDYKPFVETVGLLLDGRGIQCDTAFTIEDAMDKIKKNEYDKIFLDLLINGEFCTSLIKFCKEYGGCPQMILMSAHNEGERIAKQYSLTYLNKPFALETFEEILFKNSLKKS